MVAMRMIATGLLTVLLVSLVVFERGQGAVSETSELEIKLRYGSTLERLYAIERIGRDPRSGFGPLLEEIVTSESSADVIRGAALQALSNVDFVAAADSAGRIVSTSNERKGTSRWVLEISIDTLRDHPSLRAVVNFSN